MSPHTPDALYICGRLILNVTEDVLVDLSPRDASAAFVATPGGKLRLYFPPPHVPDRNPGALAGKHLDAAGRMAIARKDAFNRKVRSSMRQPQNDPEKILSFSRNPSLKFAA